MFIIFDIDCLVLDELMLKFFGYSIINIGKKVMGINKIFWMMFFIEFYKIKFLMLNYFCVIIFGYSISFCKIIKFFLKKLVSVFFFEIFEFV